MNHSKQKQTIFRNSAVSAGPHLNTAPADQSFSDEALQSGGQYEFTVKNNLYELQSRCNSLQYDKYKRAISYIETTNQLQSKTEYLEEMNSHLTQQVQALSDERDILRTVLGEVREQNHSFSIQINQLKMEIHKIISNQSPHYAQQRSQSIEMMRMQLVQKQRQIESMNEQLRSSQKSKITDSLSLQHERQKQKLQNEVNLVTKRESQLKVQIEELARHYKKKQNEQKQHHAKLENQLQQLLSQIEQKQQNTQALKQQYLHLSKELQQKTNSFRLIQNQRATLQTKCAELQLEVGRLRCQKTNLQQYKSYLQTINQQSETKRKALQEQIFKLQAQNSEIREQLFTQKLETKKQLSKLKLQLEEQRIRHQQTLEEKQKTINSLNQQLNLNQRMPANFGSLAVKSKSQADLEKASQRNAELMAQNEELKKEITNWESKLEKKHDKYCALESKLKKQNGERISQLEAEIYKQLQTIGELQYKLQFSKNPRKSEKTVQGNRMTEHLTDQVIQKQKRIKQLQRSVIQLENIIQYQQKRISKQQEHRNSWQINVKEEKISTISMLQQEIVRLNKELKLSQSSESTRKQQLAYREQKFAKQLLQLQNINKRKTQEIDTLIKKIATYQQEIRSKEVSLSQLKQELHKAREEKNTIEAANRAKDQQLKATILLNEQVSKNQAKRIRQDAQTSNQQISTLNQKIIQLQTQNLALKEQYSDALQQMNTLLVKYQNLQQNYKKNQNTIEKHSSTRAQNLEHQCQRLRICLQRQDQEVKRLNQMLSGSKSRVVHPHQQHRVNKISQHLWLGEQKFTMSRMEAAKGYGKQYNHQI